MPPLALRPRHVARPVAASKPVVHGRVAVRIKAQQQQQQQQQQWQAVDAAKAAAAASSARADSPLPPATPPGPLPACVPDPATAYERQPSSSSSSTAMTTSTSSSSSSSLTAPGGPPAPRTWVPISGPPSDGPAEVRRMAHPADAPELPPASLVEVATPQQLAIGKREAREQAVALATASAEISRWRAAADEALAAKALLAERARELEVQRNESMSINRELLAAYRALQTELAAAAGTASGYEGRLAALKQELLDLKTALGASAASSSGSSRSTGRTTSSGSSTSSRNGSSSSGSSDKGGPAVAAKQLLQMSQQLARDAERDEQRRAELRRLADEPPPDADGETGAEADAGSTPLPNSSSSGGSGGVVGRPF